MKLTAAYFDDSSIFVAIIEKIGLQIAAATEEEMRDATRAKAARLVGLHPDEIDLTFEFDRKRQSDHFWDDAEGEAPGFRIKFDASADATYIRLREATVIESREFAPGVMLDFDAGGQMVGVEIICPSISTPRSIT